MSTWVTTTAEFAQSAINVDSVTQRPPVDTWVASRVRIKRTSRGLTQQEFSELLDIDPNDLAAFEEGAKRINANLLFRIAMSLDVRPDYFFRGYMEEDWKTA